MSIGFSEKFDIQSLQKRLRAMSDEKLLQFGRDAKYMCSPEANLGLAPRELWLAQFLRNIFPKLPLESLVVVELDWFP